MGKVGERAARLNKALRLKLEVYQVFFENMD